MVDKIKRMKSWDNHHIVPSKITKKAWVNRFNAVHNQGYYRHII